MSLDLTPLGPYDLLWFGAAFVVVWGAVGVLHRQQWLRAVRERPAVAYGGAVLIGVVTMLLFFALDDVRLQIGLSAAAFLALFIGILDENVQLSVRQQLVWQIVIAALVVVWGWSIRFVSTWSGDGVIALDTLQFGPLLLPGAVLTIGWLLLLMNAMNWLDGVDGLAPGVGVVALLALAAVSLLPSIQDEATLRLALIGAGGVLGFLLWGWPPARVYLGTSGSWFLGLLIGLVAIVSGGKIVTTLLILAIPVLDFGLVVLQRAWSGQAPWRGDTERHLHHRLLLAGLSPRAIVALAMGLSALLGWLAVVLQTQYKVVALGLAGVLLAGLVLRLATRKAGAA